ncbi:MAG: sigma-54-dependent Fis family transcriptional regulator, partial [Planctomycetes bacterium]|nr:sigma-54-dependent Fis family transcriptional regulator [Planctomycetota bacterium]
AEEYQKAISQDEEIDDVAGKVVDLARLAKVSILTGNLRVAKEQVERLATAAAGLLPRHLAPVDIARGHLALVSGEDEGARIPLERAAAGPQSARENALEAKFLLGEVHRRHGRPEGAAEVLAGIDAAEIEASRWPVRCQYWLERARTAGTPEELSALSEPLARCLADAERFEGRLHTWQLEYVLALSSEQRGEIERALGHAQAAHRVLAEFARHLPEDCRESFLELAGRRDVRRTLQNLQNRVGSMARRKQTESSLFELSVAGGAGAPIPERGLEKESLSDVEKVVLEYQDEIKSSNLNLIREENHHLRQLLELNKNINSEHNVEKLLELIIDTAIELTGAERGFLIFSEGAELKFEIARNYEREEIPKPELRISRSIAEKTIAGGQPITTTDAAEDERFDKFSSVSELKLHSVLCVPLRAKHRVLGAIYLDNRFEQGVFTKKERTLLEAFADQAAIAIENARLLDENIKKQEEIARSKERIENLNRRLADINKALEAKVHDQSLELTGVKEELKEKQGELEGRYSYQKVIIGKSPVLLELFKLLDKVTESSVPVFIHGESGTGKELVAKAIHFSGPRRAQRFGVENCAALTETLLESELFGYVKGAFTGADKDKMGLFELANGGTLFFDEVGDMSPSMQKKLLRVLQEGEFRRVGGKDQIKVDVRIISASNKDLKTLVEQGQFRDDLYYRLNVITLRLPALRERKEDIPLLVDHFLEEYARDTKAEKRAVSKAGREALLEYHWPGNIRELRNIITSVLALSDKDTLDADDLRKAIPKRGPEPTANAFAEELSIDEYTRRFVLTFQEKYNDTEMAKILGISRKTLWEKRKRWDLLRQK